MHEAEDRPITIGMVGKGPGVATNEGAKHQQLQRRRATTLPCVHHSFATKEAVLEGFLYIV
jgi:hypothetical protein